MCTDFVFQEFRNNRAFRIRAMIPNLMWNSYADVNDRCLPWKSRTGVDFPSRESKLEVG